MKEKETIKKIYDMIQEELSEEVVKSKEYKKLSSEFSKTEQELKSVIGADYYKKVEDLLSIYVLMSDFESELSFKKGFSLANKLRDESLIKN